MKTFIRSAEAILIDLRLRGASTATELVTRLANHGFPLDYPSVSSAVTRLTDQKFLKFEKEPVEGGRPVHRYQLTALGGKRADRSIKTLKEFLAK